MTRQIATAVCFVCLIVAFEDHSFGQEPLPTQADVQVYFSPAGGCTTAAVAEIGKAKREILVQAYSFTSTPIADALVAAKKRGVDVQVLADRSDVGGLGTMLPTLKAAGVPVLIDGRHAIAHNKILIIDGATVCTGSFNFTNAAERSNAENLLIARSAELAGVYRANWQKHKQHCTPYVPALRRRKVA